MDHASPQPKPRRRWLRFSLRGLFVLIIIVSIAIALPMHWQEDDIAQYKVEQQVATQIESMNGTFYGAPISSREEVSWFDYPSYLWQKSMNWGHGTDLYDDIHSVTLPIRDLDRLAPQLKKLRSLEKINISTSNVDDFGMPLYDEEIKQIADVETLEELDLSEVNVTPSQLQELSSLPNLRHLAFPVRGDPVALIEALPSFPKLEHIKIDDLPITQSTVAKLEQLPNLQILTLSSFRPKADSGGIQAMGRLTQMQWLVIDVPSLDHRWYDALAKMPQLTNLYIKGARQIDAAPGDAFAKLSTLTNLEVLTIDGIRLDDKALETIGKMKSLTELHCDASLTTDAGMKHLAGLPKLKEANLSGTQITIHGLYALSKSPSLDYVHLGAGFQLSLQDHRKHFCGNCAGPVDYAETNQFGEPYSPWKNLVPRIEGDSNEDSSSPEYLPGEDPFAPPTQLPDNFADTINDPFLPTNQELASE